MLCPNTTDGTSYKCPQLEGMWVNQPIRTPGVHFKHRFYNGNAPRGDFGILNGRFAWGWHGYPRFRGYMDGVISPAEVRQNLKDVINLIF